MQQPSELNWQRKAPDVKDKEGDYLFKFVFYITEQAKCLVTYEEMIQIILELRRLAKLHDGIGAIQVFEMEEHCVYVVDKLSESVIKEGNYENHDAYATILTQNEYGYGRY